MFTRKFGSINAAQPRRFSPLYLTLASSLFLGGIALTGCGGGGGGSTLPAPVVTPTPTASPIATTSAKDRSVSANFVPNYVPATPAHYLHWASNKNLRIFIRPSVNNITDNAPSSTIDSATALNVVQQGLNNWTTATGGDFTFTLVDSATNADIEIVFVDSLIKSNGTVATGVGLSNFDFIYPDSSDTTHGTLTKAVAQIIAKQETPNLVDTISHELGHTLGIEQHSADDTDLLYATSLPPATITQRDQNTIFFLYYSSVAAPGRAVKTSVKNAEVHSEEIVCDPK